MAAAAVLVAASIGAVMVYSDGIRELLVRWLGPPEVELREAYAGDGGRGVRFDHSELDALLREHVGPRGMVDYDALADDEAALRRYVRSIADAPFSGLGRDEKLALLINAYNAFTLVLILEHRPLDSIRDIPSDERWEARRWKLGGEVYSLEQIEHEEIRPKFREPRIHFALVCAAKSCPPLRREAYTGDRIDAQLADQAHRFLHDPRGMRYHSGAGKMELSSIFQWYRGDFEQVAGSLPRYVARYRADVASDLEAGREPEVRFLDYDWSLNSRGMSLQ